jgi:transcriptional regulator with XRE-family HTH domain
MITYEKYAEIRDEKKLTDGKVAKMCGFGRSTFSDWKSGRSIPKIDKMQKIADALDMDYAIFVGRVGKFSSLNPDNPLRDLKVDVDRTALLPEDDKILISDLLQNKDAYNRLIEYAKLLKLQIDQEGD